MCVCVQDGNKEKIGENTKVLLTNRVDLSELLADESKKVTHYNLIMSIGRAHI